MGRRQRAATLRSISQALLIGKGYGRLLPIRGAFLCCSNSAGVIRGQEILRDAGRCCGFPIAAAICLLSIYKVPGVVPGMLCKLSHRIPTITLSFKITLPGGGEPEQGSK